MSNEEIERVDDEAIAAWGRHDPDAIAAACTEDTVWTDVMAPEPFKGKDAVRAYTGVWFTAFPDMVITRMNRVVGGDSVAGEVEFTGTNSGPMTMAGKEIPPTGKSVVGRGAYFARIRDGKIAEFKAYPDIAGMMTQLGFMPEM